MFKKNKISSIKNANIKKYLAYAIGEILIIIIGIFIALYFNKLKEKEINKVYINEVLKDINLEAKDYLERSIRFNNYNAKRDTLARKIVANQITEINDYEIDGVHSLEILHRIGEISFNSIHVINLGNRINYLNIKENKIYNDLLYIDKNQKGYKSVGNNAIKILNDYKTFRRTNNEWYYLTSDDTIAEQKEFNYRLKSFRYKNFVKDFWTYEVLNKTNNISFFQCLSFKLLFKLTNNQNEKLKPRQIDSIFTKHNFKRMTRIKCDSILPKKQYALFDKIHLYNILYNGSKDTITVKQNNKKIVIPPKGYNINTFINDTELTIFIKDECRAKYKTQINSYLFYE